MKSFRINPKVLTFAALASVALSSCNRGYGCPTNFSIGDSLEVLLTTLAALV